MAKKVKLEDISVKSFVTTNLLKGGYREAGSPVIQKTDPVEEETQWGDTMCTETACMCA